jgi:osmotically-inducible protein OsmY
LTKRVNEARAGLGASAADEEKHGAVGVLSADEELQQAVCSALIDASDLDSRGIGVSAQKGRIVLTGVVRSREDWLRAERIARDHTGVDAVQTAGLIIEDE